MSMDTTAITKIEAALGVKLPDHYIELVTNYPAELEETEAPDFALFDNPDVIISENSAVRGKSFYGGTWPENLFIIGNNGCGDLYVTTLNSNEFSTGFFDHEAPAFFPHSTSRAEFISKIVAEQNGEGA